MKNVVVESSFPLKLDLQLFSESDGAPTGSTIASAPDAPTPADAPAPSAAPTPSDAPAPSASPAPAAAPTPTPDQYGRVGENPLKKWVRLGRPPDSNEPGAQKVSTPAASATQNVPAQQATSTQQTGTQNAQSAPPEPEMLDFGGRKVPVVDPVIRELHRDFTHATRTIAEQAQLAKMQNEQLQSAMQIIEQLRASGQQSQQPSSNEPPNPTPEEIDKFFDDWNTNPYAVLNSMMKNAIQEAINTSVKPVIEPIQKERQYVQQVQELRSKVDDFDQVLPYMQQAIQENPEWANNQTVETIYTYAKGLMPKPEPAPTIEQMLADPNMRKRILADESLRNEIVSAYMQTVNQQNQSVPPVMSGGAGAGTPPAAPPNKPRTVREATMAFARSLGL